MWEVTVRLELHCCKLHVQQKVSKVIHNGLEAVDRPDGVEVIQKGMTSLE